MVLIVWPLVHFKIDGLTMCVGPVVVVALNPKLGGEEREATIRHELTHVRQIHEQGCFTIIKKRWTGAGREELEWEAIQAEMHGDRS